MQLTTDLIHRKPGETQDRNASTVQELMYVDTLNGEGKGKSIKG